ncbi:venom protease isoform X2 [Eurosta solidaginis]
MRSGLCVSINSCPQFMQDYYEASRTSSQVNDFQMFVSNSMCGFDGNNFMVCCATTYTSPQLGIPLRQAWFSNPAIVQQNAQNANGLQFSSLNSNAAIQLPINVQGSSKVAAENPNTSKPNPSNQNFFLQNTANTVQRGSGMCGISGAYTNKVVGGAESKRGAYPWIAALGYREENKPNAVKFLCGGSLISSRYILTSGHCINALLTTARLGAHDISNPNEVGAINIPIERKVVHEQYISQTVTNDIGLIQLGSEAPKTAKIGPICLPEGEVFNQDFVGMHPFVAGWGAVQFQGPSSNVLRDVQVPIVNQQTCEQSYRSIFQYMTFKDKFICAGNSHVDACQGDSGGPLMMPMLQNGVYKYYILGVVSYGYECARAGFPGVYTRVASYIPWIISHVV